MRVFLLLGLILAGCGVSPSSVDPQLPVEETRAREITQSVSLNAGWNPLAFQCQRLNQLQADPQVVGMVWFDGTAYQTVSVDAASSNSGQGPRRGFWVFCSSAGSLNYTGDDDGQGNLQELHSGWNLISLASASPAGALTAEQNGRPVGLESVLLPQAFEIQADNSSRSVDLSGLQPGRCYWLFASTGVRLTWGPRPTPSPSPVLLTSPSPRAVASPSPLATPAASPGGPLTGLSAEQVARFQEGRREFTASLRGTRQLGPIFNGFSCVECHGGPTVGGGSPIVVTRFGRTTAGVFDPLVAEGGSLLQALAGPGVALERVPASANTVARRRSTPVFGLGLVEAIPDQAIIDLAAHQSPEIAGQVNFVGGRVGRFGWKCQQATLLDFAGDALANEHGVSNAVAAFENQPNQSPRAVPADQVEDRPGPDGRRDIDRLADFMRFLAPLPGGLPSTRGEALFSTVGCASCHQPSFETVSSEPGLNGRRVFAYSDFLLHDVGTGDGIAQGDAPANKLRTAPLLGVARQASWLHDGSARSLTQAIRAHAGQARTSAQAFQGLTLADRNALLAFLNSL